MAMHRTTCKVGACEPFCGIEVEVEGGRMVSVRPDPNHPVTKGYACIKGMHVPDYVNHPERPLHPMARGPAGLERVEWPVATRQIGERLVDSEHVLTERATVTTMTDLIRLKNKFVTR